MADASAVSVGLRELDALANTAGWVAEAPEAHLLPHLRAACEQTDSFFMLDSSAAQPDGSFLVTLRLRDASAGIAEIRARLFELIGEVAETATYIRQRGEPLLFEVLTGTTADGTFAPHGHLLVVRVEEGGAHIRI